MTVRSPLFSFVLFTLSVGSGARNGAPAAEDVRNLDTGPVIGGIANVYADQPMCIRRQPDLAWLCLTTVSTAEGAPDERVVASISTDRGASWSGAAPLDPGSSGEIEYAYAAPFQASDGRIWALYVINSDNITALPSTGARITRTDMLGHFKMRHSDDGGATWSAQAWEVPVPPPSTAATTSTAPRSCPGWSTTYPSWATACTWASRRLGRTA
jgi:hypothetical protein